jgi:hypothetical protein
MLSVLFVHTDFFAASFSFVIKPYLACLLYIRNNFESLQFLCKRVIFVTRFYEIQRLTKIQIQGVAILPFT